MSREKGNEVIINNFCIAISTLISALALPKRIIPIENMVKMILHKRRCFFEGSCLPSSVNMLNTKMAESREVTKKLMRRRTVNVLINPWKG